MNYPIEFETKLERRRRQIRECQRRTRAKLKEKKNQQEREKQARLKQRVNLIQEAVRYYNKDAQRNNRGILQPRKIKLIAKGNDFFPVTLCEVSMNEHFDEKEDLNMKQEGDLKGEGDQSQAEKLTNPEEIERENNLSNKSNSRLQPMEDCSTPAYSISDSDDMEITETFPGNLCEVSIQEDIPEPDVSQKATESEDKIKYETRNRSPVCNGTVEKASSSEVECDLELEVDCEDSEEYSESGSEHGKKFKNFQSRILTASSNISRNKSEDHYSDNNHSSDSDKFEISQMYPETKLEIKTEEVDLGIDDYYEVEDENRWEDPIDYEINPVVEILDSSDEVTEVHEIQSYKMQSYSYMRQPRHVSMLNLDGTYSCNECDYTALSRTSVMSHYNRWHYSRLLSCEYCGYKTPIKTNLIIHMRRHTGEKPFKCTQCKYRASQKGTLKVHMLKHSGVKPWTCDMCPYSTIYKTCLTSHMRTHTGERPYACEQCPYQASHRASLKVHLKTHQKPRGRGKGKQRGREERRGRGRGRGWSRRCISTGSSSDSTSDTADSSYIPSGARELMSTIKESKEEYQVSTSFEGSASANGVLKSESHKTYPPSASLQSKNMTSNVSQDGDNKESEVVNLSEEKPDDVLTDKSNKEPEMENNTISLKKDEDSKVVQAIGQKPDETHSESDLVMNSTPNQNSKDELSVPNESESSDIVLNKTFPDRSTDAVELTSQKISEDKPTGDVNVQSELSKLDSKEQEVLN